MWGGHPHRGKAHSALSLQDAGKTGPGKPEALKLVSTVLTDVLPEP